MSCPERRAVLSGDLTSTSQSGNLMSTRLRRWPYRAAPALGAPAAVHKHGLPADVAAVVAGQELDDLRGEGGTWWGRKEE